MGLINLFNIRATYQRWKAKQMVFYGPKCQIVIHNLQIKGITYKHDDPPSLEEIQEILNRAVREMTTMVTNEFGI